MRAVVIFGGEGVLYRPNEAFAASEPIFEGLDLYKQMVQSVPCHVLCDTDNQMFADNWLKLNGAKDAISHIHSDIDGLAVMDFHWQQICRIRSQGPIWLVVTAYQPVAARCANAGLFALTFHRPGGLTPMPRKPWHERIEEQRDASIRRASQKEDDHAERHLSAPY